MDILWNKQVGKRNCTQINMSDPAHYEIRVKGHLSSQWANQFGGLAIDNLPNGEALLSGTLPDQAALHGVLNRILYLGLTLVSLNRTELEPKDKR